MALKLAERGKVDPFIVMDVLRAANQRAAAGGDVLHLEIGQPGHGAPKAARDAAKRAVDEVQLGYTDAGGLPELRRRIAGSYRELHGLELDPERVMVTSGSSAGFVVAFLSAFDPGDRVAELAPAMDVAWVTSEPRSEGVPTACGEAMALAVPPVAFDIGGLRDLVRDRIDGRIVPGQDTDALALATAELLASPVQRAALGRSARAQASELCSVDACAAAHLLAFEIIERPVA